MRLAASRVEGRALYATLASCAAALCVGWMAGRAPLVVPFIVVAGLVVFAVAFLKTELAVHILILSMLLSPEIAVGGSIGGSGMEGARSAVVRIEDLLLVVMGVAWLARISVFKELGLVLKTPLNAIIGLYALVITISTLVGVSAGRVSPAMGLLFVGKYLEYFVIYFLVVNHARSRRSLDRMLITAGVTALAVALIAMAQIPTGERVSAPFEGERGEPNTLGGYLVLMMCVLGGMALEAPRRKTRWLLAAAVAMLAVPLLYTLSRSSWMAATASALVLLVMSRQWRRLLPVLAVGGILLVAFIPKEVVDRAGYTFSTHRESVVVGDVALDSSTSARIRSWSEALTDSASHPFLGHGVTGYHFIDAQYFRILAETGLIGLVVFLALIYQLYRRTRESSLRLSDPMLRGLCTGFLAALAGLLVHAFGGNTFIIVRIMEPFWLVAGLVMVAPLIEGDGSEDSKEIAHAGA